jgi:hypothetical protein
MSTPTTVASTTLPATWCRSKCWRRVISVEFLDDKAREIVARMSTRHDEMRGERGFGRAHLQIFRSCPCRARKMRPRWTQPCARK